ncbi:MAG: DUF6242 domain-containing protein [Dysgonamonadaceae bacterium]|jgi:hypothetical protein|nr:DUF6242 domain-containing protein [Dysgonamonadaceae bacterium]
MHLKTGFYILLVSLGLTSLVSCLGGSDYYDYEISTDAQLSYFALSHDSLPVLATAKFSIDQAQSLIYNYDSLPYLTDTAKIASKAIIQYTAASGAAPSIRIEHLNGDTAWIAAGDTLQMASQFALKLYAPGGQSKTYTVSIRIHQMDPDSVQYRPVALSDVPGETTPDWNSLTQHCPDTLEVVAYLGFLRPDEQKQLALIVKDKDVLRFAFSSDLIEYQLGATIPAGFPVSGFSRLNDRSFAGRLTVIAGLQSVWATDNGLYWTNLFGTEAPLPEIEGGNAFSYNGEIWFLNGKIAGGDYNPKVYYSRNGGIVWEEKPFKIQPPADFPLRQDARVVVDADGKYFYITGGRNNEGQLDDAWQAALNARTFDH